MLLLLLLLLELLPLPLLLRGFASRPQLGEQGSGGVARVLGQPGAGGGALGGNGRRGRLELPPLLRDVSQGFHHSSETTEAVQADDETPRQRGKGVGGS